MRYIFLALVILMSVSVPAVSQLTPKQIERTVDEITIRQVLDEQGRALKQQDIATLDGLWAADYIFINPAGQIVTKDQRLKVLASSDTKIDFLSRDEVNVRTYGNAAVVVSRTTAKGRVAGRDVDAQFRATTVLVKRDGRWLIVSHQDNIIPPPR